MGFDAARRRRAYNARQNAGKKARRAKARRETEEQQIANGHAYGIRAPSGRKTKLDKPTYESICRLLAEGQTVDLAATLSGVDSATLYSWIRLGQDDPNGPFGQFVADLQYAKEASHRFLVNKIVYDEDWKAAAWLLKNRFPKLYRDHISQEIQGPDGGPVQMALQTFNVVLELHPDDSGKNEPQREFRIEGAAPAAAHNNGHNGHTANGADQAGPDSH